MFRSPDRGQLDRGRDPGNFGGLDLIPSGGRAGLWRLGAKLILLIKPLGDWVPVRAGLDGWTTVVVVQLSVGEEVGGQGRNLVPSASSRRMIIASSGNGRGNEAGGGAGRNDGGGNGLYPCKVTTLLASPHHSAIALTG